MKRYNLEIKLSVEEYIPIVIQAEGSDFDSLCENAEYAMDVPDPARYYNIANLTSRSYDNAIGAIREEMAAQDEMRAEALADR